MGRHVLGMTVDVGFTSKSGHTVQVSTVAPERVLLWIWGRGELAKEIGRTS